MRALRDTDTRGVFSERRRPLFAPLFANHSLVDAPKHCKSCGDTKPLDAFRPHPKTRDRRRSTCRACENAATNSRRDATYHQRYRESHAEHMRALVQAWRDAHPERVRDHNRVSKQRRRARAEAAEGRYTADDLATIYRAQGGLCAYCERPLSTSYHVEHKTPLVRGGTHWPDNLCLACERCNKRKGSKTEAEFMAWRL